MNFMPCIFHETALGIRTLNSVSRCAQIEKSFKMKPLLVWHAYCCIYHHEKWIAAQKLSIGIVMITVKGILIPVNWDQKGNVVSVAIATDEEKEYLVADPSEGAVIDDR